MCSNLTLDQQQASQRADSNISAQNSESSVQSQAKYAPNTIEDVKHLPAPKKFSRQSCVNVDLLSEIQQTSVQTKAAYSAAIGRMVSTSEAADWNRLPNSALAIPKRF